MQNVLVCLLMTLLISSNQHGVATFELSLWGKSENV